MSSCQASHLIDNNTHLYVIYHHVVIVHLLHNYIYFNYFFNLSWYRATTIIAHVFCQILTITFTSNLMRRPLQKYAPINHQCDYDPDPFPNRSKLNASYTFQWFSDNLLAIYLLKDEINNINTQFALKYTSCATLLSFV